MFEVLGNGTHKIANILFVALNALAIIFCTSAIVVTTAFFTSTDMLPFLGFFRIVAGFGLFLGHVAVGAMLAVVAQALRYVAIIASATSKTALASPVTAQTTP